MTKNWVCSLFSLFFVTTGCAVNEYGFVRTHYFENDSSYLVKQVALGGYLSTRQADGGLTLGYAERIFVYPKPGKLTDLSLDRLLRQLSSGGFEKEIDAEDVDLTDVQPYGWVEKNQGVIFHGNSLKAGVSVGLESRNVIWLPADFNGVFMFRYLENGRIESVIQEVPNGN